MNHTFVRRCTLDGRLVARRVSIDISHKCTARVDDNETLIDGKRASETAVCAASSVRSIDVRIDAPLSVYISERNGETERA